MKYGCCIITEQLKHNLDSPIIMGKDTEIFNTDQECIELCHSLLKNKDQIELLKKNAEQYYNDNIKAENIIKKHLYNTITSH